MKTKKTTPAYFSELEIKMPTGYQDLNQKQLRYVYLLMSQQRTADEIKTYCFLRFAGMMVLKRVASEVYEVRSGMRTYNVSVASIAASLSVLDWLEKPAPFPTRLEQIGKAKALPPLMQRLPFGQFLVLEMLYQGFILSQNYEAIQDMAAIMYPGLNKKLDGPEIQNIIMWFCSAKLYYAYKWTYLFAKSDDDDGEDDIDPEKNMNTMLRALTGGHPEREKDIEALDTFRALEELDQKAREAQEFKEKTH